MYRVELKVVKVNCLVSWIPHGFLMYRVELKVHFLAIPIWAVNPFLMHRVELKEENALDRMVWGIVPNAPCGVESQLSGWKEYWGQVFLMHRVELKVSKDVGKPFHCKLF